MSMTMFLKWSGLNAGLSAGPLLPQEARCLRLGENGRKTASRWQGAWMSLPGQRSG
jgi:hypothetical protein